MNDRLTRRVFVQTAIAGAAAVATASLTDKLLARSQPADLVVLGVQAGPVPTTNDVPVPGTIEVDPTAGSSTGPGNSIPVPLLAQSLDLTTGQVQSLTLPQVLPDGSPVLQSGDAVTGSTILTDGTLVLTITPAETGNPTRLLLFRTPPLALPVTGLKKHEELESVVATNDGGLLGLVMRKNGGVPVSLVDVDLTTGAISYTNKVILPGTERFGALALCPDGTLYTTALDWAGYTSLVRLDLGQKKPIVVAQLSVNGVPWNNGLASLVCSGGSGTSQLLALGAPRYVTPNAVYSVDMGSGALTWRQDFDVAKMTLSRS